MKKVFFVLVIVSMCGIIAATRIDPPDSHPSTDNAITVEDDVLLGNTLPQYGEICQETDVYGAPHGTRPLGHLNVGERVRLHEPDKQNDGWVSIAAARWIPLDALCWDG